VINGHITDTTFTNLAFHTGSEWITPVKPLLAGTRRAALIKQKIIVTASIREENIFNYLTIRLFNALLPWEEAIELPISAIRI
jgi:4-amino-4-deoxychorismate lyase